MNLIILYSVYQGSADLDEVLEVLTRHLLEVVFPSDVFPVVGVERRVSFHPDGQSGDVPLSVCSGFFLLPLRTRCAIFLAHADNHVG